ncbi:MAG: SDR family oxidoreductase [Pseudonocardia sp.]|nr:SDR family oxidoreductase [Pseudonocardia sp.]MBO0875634.1 SDR family oxidoreductase [Pseudonocardia sp.]
MPLSRRVGTGHGHGGVIAFLAGADSEFMTGQTLVVDGGVAFNRGQPVDFH